MEKFTALLSIYLSIGFAKFVLDMSRLHIFVRLIEDLEMEVHGISMPATRRWALAVFGMLVQCFLFWPEILIKGGVREFLLPVTEAQLRHSCLPPIHQDTDERH